MKFSIKQFSQKFYRKISKYKYALAKIILGKVQLLWEWIIFCKALGKGNNSRSIFLECL